MAGICRNNPKGSGQKTCPLPGFFVHIFRLMIAGLLIFPACARRTTPAPADLVLNNGVIYTVDGLSSTAEAVAIKDGRLVFVGSNAGAAAYIGSRTAVTDLQGRFALPGFIDSHAHALSAYRVFFEKDGYDHNLQVPYLGQARVDDEYPTRSFFEAGVPVASSSDYPVTIPCHPLIAVQTGITRREPGNADPAAVVWPEESVSLERMIHSFTINGAIAHFLESETGSIEAGKSAALIVLDCNLFEIPVEEIGRVKVRMTVFKGKTLDEDEAGGQKEGEKL